MGVSDITLETSGITLEAKAMEVEPPIFSAFLADDEATVNFGKALAKACKQGAIIYLQGDLGAGKTTLSRGVMRYFGHEGAVKSPTYTLVEPYLLAQKSIYHFDLYRLADPEELEYLGMRDAFSPENICLLEWPSKGAGFLPKADMVISLRTIPAGRDIEWQGEGEKGENQAKALYDDLQMFSQGGN